MGSLISALLASKRQEVTTEEEEDIPFHISIQFHAPAHSPASFIWTPSDEVKAGKPPHAPMPLSLVVQMLAKYINVSVDSYYSHEAELLLSFMLPLQDDAPDKEVSTLLISPVVSRLASRIGISPNRLAYLLYLYSE